jgi:hypothetical protein
MTEMKLTEGRGDLYMRGGEVEKARGPGLILFSRSISENDGVRPDRSSSIPRTHIRASTETIRHLVNIQ